jgi:CubicO group peptidase (beta-lactamase class C family)
MRRPLIVLTVALAVVLWRAPIRAQSPVFQLFSEYIEVLRAQTGIPGMAGALVSSTDVLWDSGFGRQDVERFVSAQSNTPFHIDALTQLFTATMILRCAEEGSLSLDDRIARFSPSDPNADLTLRQVLSHTSGAADSLVFDYRPQRYEPLKAVIRACTSDSYRETLANVLDRLAMGDSVPGPDVVTLVPPAEGIPDAGQLVEYARSLDRLAIPYAVDVQRRATPSRYQATTLAPWGGLITTARDFAKFDLALKRGILLRGSTLAEAWRAPNGRLKQPLPHGLGWFVQTYNGEKIVWQFGAGDNASSSLVVTVPGRGLTLILLANSHGLVKAPGQPPLPLADGDVTISPFARLFLGLFVR